MGDVVNLNQFRKKQARQAAEEKAAANRVTFGRRKEDRETAKALLTRSELDLDGKRLD